MNRQSSCRLETDASVMFSLERRTYLIIAANRLWDALLDASPGEHGTCVFVLLHRSNQGVRRE